MPATAVVETATGAGGAAGLIWLLPVLPLAGFAVNLLFGRRLRAAAGWIATLAVLAAFAVTVAAVLDLVSLPAEERRVVVHGWEWFAGVAMDLRLDPLSATLALVITGIGGLIHLYSIGYMAHDERPGTYFAYLNLFVAAMLTLVLGQNLLVTFLGWEGVGLCSYLLIGFWYNRRLLAVEPSADATPVDRREVAAPAAAKKAFVANRVGDAGFLLAMFLLFRELGSLDYDVVLDAVGAGALSAGVATAAALLLFLACTGKSAQIPLFTWLPDAMAGPTPVSALIHAATMVTAGVFLVARMHSLFEASATASAVVVLVGALTALVAALIAIGQDDIKRILAFSTVSQLGYMFIGVGLGPIGYVAGIFHLVTHAFFKAQLFLGAGSVMHANDDDTDVKRFGGLRSRMRVTWITMGISWLAIIGIVPLSGFWSKEQILGSALDHGGAVATTALVIGVGTAGITAFYMSRLFFLTFHGTPRWPQGRDPHESPAIMTVPLLLLAAGAAVAGVLNLNHDGILAHFLEPVFAEGAVEPEPAGPTVPAWVLPLVTTVITVASASLAWLLYGAERFSWRALRVRWAGLYRTLAARLYVDTVYEAITVTGGRAFAALLAGVDRVAVDGSADGAGRTVTAFAGRWRRLQNGLVRSYAVGILGGAALLLAFLVIQGIR